MDILQQGAAIAWGFGIVALGIFVVQIWSWIIYSQYFSEIAEKRQDLLNETDPEKKQALLERFSNTGSHLGARIKLVNQSVLHKRSVGIQELSLLTEEEDSRQWFVVLPNTSISTFLIAGLAGTIYLLQALLRSVFKNGESIIDANGQLSSIRMAEIVNTLYPGFSHVFAVTFVGIVCTLIILIVRNLLIYRKKSAFFQEIDKFTIEFLLPVEVKLTDILAPFVKSMDVLAATIMDSSRKNTEAIERSSKANAEAIEKSARLNMEVGKANLQTAKIALETVNTLGQFATAMNDAGNQMRQAAKELAISNTVLGSTFAADGQWAKLQGALAESQTKLKDAVDDIQLKIAALCADVTGLRDAGETLAAVDYQGLQRNLLGLAGSLDKSDTVWTQLGQTHEALLKDLVNSPNSLNNTFIELNKSAANFAPQLVDGQNRLLNNLTTIDENLPALQSGLQQTSAHLLQLCAAMIELNKADFPGLHDGINGLEASLRTAVTDYAALVENQKTISKEMVDIKTALQMSFAGLETSITELRRQIANTRSEMADTSSAMQDINSNTAALAKIDFTGIQQQLDALLSALAGTQSPELAFPAIQKEMTDLSVLLRNWMDTNPGERTPGKLEEILTRLQRLESEKSNAENSGLFK